MLEALNKNHCAKHLDCNETITMAREGKLIYISMKKEMEPFLCQYLHDCFRKYTNSMKTNEDGKRYFVRRYDSDASEIKKQFIVSKSIRGVLGERTVYSKMRHLTENGLLRGLNQRTNKLAIGYSRLLARLYRRKPFSSTEYHCFADAPPTDIQTAGEFHLTEMKKFSLVISFLLIIAFI